MHSYAPYRRVEFADAPTTTTRPPATDISNGSVRLRFCSRIRLCLPWHVAQAYAWRVSRAWWSYSAWQPPLLVLSSIIVPTMLFPMLLPMRCSHYTHAVTNAVTNAVTKAATKGATNACTNAVTNAVTNAITNAVTVTGLLLGSACGLRVCRRRRRG